jgi:hypothetical protein
MVKFVLADAPRVGKESGGRRVAGPPGLGEAHLELARYYFYAGIHTGGIEPPDGCLSNQLGCFVGISQRAGLFGQRLRASRETKFSI